MSLIELLHTIQMKIKRRNRDAKPVLSFTSASDSDGLTDGETDTGSKRFHQQMWQALLLEAVFSLALAFHPDIMRT
jgi:hypothetical protein